MNLAAIRHHRTLSLLLGLLLLPALALAEPSADVQKINGLLSRAEVNLQNVQQNLAGRSAPPKGSAGKLLAQRLQQAYGDLEPAGQLVTGLDANAEGAAEATQRYQTASELYTQLATIMNGGQAPEAPAEAEPGTVKLGYPHADQFKNTLFTLRGVEADVDALVKLHAELMPVADQLTVNYRKTAAALEEITEARRQAGFVDDGLAQIPANGEGVAQAHERLAEVRKALDGAEAYFKPLNDQLTTIVDPAQYPKYQQDVQRLDAIKRDYGADYVFVNDRPRAAELYQQRQASYQEVVRIAQTYQRPLQQQPEWIGSLEAAGNGAIANFKKFDASIEQQKQTLPSEIQKHLKAADDYANEAVQAQKPQWFTGGIPQEMEFADDKITLLEAIDPEAGKTARQNYADLQASLEQRADSLKELIIQENKPPADNFQGPDRQKAIDTAIDAWTHQEEDFEVLGASIPAEAWERQEKHYFSGSVSGGGNVSGEWSKQDRSHIQVQLLIAVKDKPELAKIIPVNVYKDHMKGETMIGTPLFAGDEELQPRFFLLRNKIR